MTQIINDFREISNNFRAIFCDLWGCLHNGKKSFPESLAALSSFRKAGGVVILLTNAPRPKTSVSQYINQLGISEDFYDDLITSGDAARFSFFSGKFGTQVFHIGPSRDLCFFDEMQENKINSVAVNLVEISEASCIVCTGLFNDRIEHPSDYKTILKEGVKRSLSLLCANPDIQVDYGKERLWCAGALAALYTEAGGSSIYFGKPHKPIYDLALTRIKQINPDIETHDVLCIGDGINTDILGGLESNMKTLFVCGGLSRDEISINRITDLPDEKKLKSFIKACGVKLRAL